MDVIHIVYNGKQELCDAKRYGGQTNTGTTRANLSSFSHKGYRHIVLSVPKYCLRRLHESYYIQNTDKHRNPKYDNTLLPCGGNMDAANLQISHKAEKWLFTKKLPVSSL